MTDPNIQNILAALAAQSQAGTPSQAGPPVPNAQYPPHQYGPPPGAMQSYGLPQPINSGSVDLGGIRPISSGSVSIADALAKAKGFAADKGVAYDPRSVSRNDPRSSYGRSHSPTPPRGRDNYRDAFNPYRDERRGGNNNNNNNNDRFPRNRSNSPRERYGSPGYRERSPGRARDAPVEGDSEVVPIEKSLVGLIIGRAGENLRRVEQTTGARVQFVDGPETAGTQRHCRISGNRTARTSAKAEIFKIIEDNELAKRGQDKPRAQGRQSGQSGQPGQPGQLGQPGQPAEVTEEGDSLQMMVPDRTVGLIIGRGGETIRDLQERSGCHVNIVAENKSVNGFRPVNLIGSAASQRHAKDLILEIVESDQKGISIKDLHSRREDPYGKLNDNIMVPGEAVGMIIGKGGETIREMQNSTGCKINVSPASGRDIEREIGLIGTRGAIDAAKRAIREKVDTVTSRNRPQGESRDNYGDRYGSQQPAGLPAGGMPPAQASSAPVPAAAGGADPYAAYGGYNNYVQMWYAAVAAQQQGGPGQGEQR